jgi:WD repeat-containing protein 22
LYLHDDAVLSISVNPKQSEIFATACHNGEISLYDQRLSNTDPIILASSQISSSSSSSFSSSIQRRAGGAFYSCCFNPVESNLLAVGNEISGLSLIDIRMKSTLIRYKSEWSNQKETNKLSRKCSNDYKQMIMSCRFNQNGNQLVVLRGNLRPALYFLNDESPIYLFDHQDFKNSCTLKNICLAGENDQYLISGSDGLFIIFL